jgi:hypothetical protein
VITCDKCRAKLSPGQTILRPLPFDTGEIKHLCDNCELELKRVVAAAQRMWMDPYSVQGYSAANQLLISVAAADAATEDEPKKGKGAK